MSGSKQPNYISCPLCGGTGHRYEQISRPDAVDPSKTFTFQKRVTCYSCNGTGRLYC